MIPPCISQGRASEYIEPVRLRLLLTKSFMHHLSWRSNLTGMCCPEPLVSASRAFVFDQHGQWATQSDVGETRRVSHSRLNKLFLGTLPHSFQGPSFQKTFRMPGETAIGFWKERWLKRMESESTPRLLLSATVALSGRCLCPKNPSLASAANCLMWTAASRAWNARLHRARME